MLMVLTSGSTRSVRKAHSATDLVPQQSPYRVMATASKVKLPVYAIMVKLTTSRANATYMRGLLPILSLMLPAGNLARVFAKPRMVKSSAMLESLKPSWLAAYMLKRARNKD